ncbi:MAG: hypothetical protein J5787_00365 [Alphaproteobacteria bacterium]|nr:hypothetical protein [Alphaproteobacteria bacterium]
MTAIKAFLSEKKNRLPLFFMALLFILIFCAAWISDDSFVAMRSVKNFLQGHGWRYNISERVQIATSSLLLIVMTVAAFFTREYYFTLMFLNISATMAALYLFYFKQEKSVKQLVFCSILFVFSAAFLDYASSGLENSFGYLLFALFLLRFFSKTVFDDKDIFYLSLLTGLILLNRMDTLLIVFPAWAYACLRCYEGKKKRLFFLACAGLSPFILWEIFCVIYYGFPFPNSYYTKLNSDISLDAYLNRGISYYLYSLLFDTITLFGIAAGLFAMFYKPADFRFKTLGIGIVLYLLYILYIGGDFMGGRFFSVPFFICLFVLPYNPECAVFNLKKSAFFIIVCLLTTGTSICVHSGPVCLLFKDQCLLEENGVVNEKWLYVEAYKYLNGVETKEMPIDFLSKQKGNVQIYFTAGFKAFSEPDIHIIDIYGLTNPLLVRLPLIDQENFRIGHFLRALPKGYKESLISGKNLIQDPEIAAYYDKLYEVVSGDIFSFRRFKYIWELNTKKPFPKDHLFKKTSLSSEQYENILKNFQNKVPYPEFLRLIADKIDLPVLQKDLKKYDFHIDDELVINLEKPSHSSILSVDMERSTFGCQFLGLAFFNTEKKAVTLVNIPFSEQMNIDIPEEARKHGFNQILITKSNCLINDLYLLKKFELID